MRLAGGLIVMMASLLSAEEVQLTDGTVLVGTIIPSADTSRVDLQMRITGLEVIRHIERTRIAAIVPGTDEVHQRVHRLEERRAALQARRTATAEEWWSLACDAHAAGEKALAEEWAWREVLGRDPDHADARASLGYLQVDGQWKTPGQLAMERGEVWHEGAWVRPEERDAAIEARRQAQSEESVRFAGRVAEQRRRAADERREADAVARATAVSSTWSGPSISTTTSSTYPYAHGSYPYRSWSYRPSHAWYGSGGFPSHHDHHACPPPVIWRIAFSRPIILLIPMSSWSMVGPPYRSGCGR